VRRVATDDGDDDGENSINQLQQPRRRRRRVGALSGSPAGQRVEEEELQNGNVVAATSGPLFSAPVHDRKDEEGLRREEKRGEERRGENRGSKRSMNEKAKCSKH
jgi:hypothetical protein